MIVTASVWLAEILWVHWIAATVIDGLADADPMTSAAVALQSLHLALHPPDVVGGYVWELGTYMLLHDPVGPGHIFLNLLFVWLFGAELEMRWGGARFLRFYVQCGVLAGVFVMLWSWVMPGEWGRHTLGASGALYALIAAYGVLYPNRRMWPIPIKVKHFVWGLVGLTILYFLMRSGDSFAAHMGGIIAGYLITTGNWRPRRWKDHLRLWQLKRRRSRLVVVKGDDEAPPTNGRTLH